MVVSISLFDDNENMSNFYLENAKKSEHGILEPYRRPHIRVQCLVLGSKGRSRDVETFTD